MCKLSLQLRNILHLWLVQLKLVHPLRHLLLMIRMHLILPPTDILHRIDLFPRLREVSMFWYQIFLHFCLCYCHSLEYLNHLYYLVVAVFPLLIQLSLFHQFVPKQVYYDLLLEVRSLTQKVFVRTVWSVLNLVLSVTPPFWKIRAMSRLS